MTATSDTSPLHLSIDLAHTASHPKCVRARSLSCSSASWPAPPPLSSLCLHPRAFRPKKHGSTNLHRSRHRFDLTTTVVTTGRGTIRKGSCLARHTSPESAVATAKASFFNVTMGPSARLTTLMICPVHSGSCGEAEHRRLPLE